MYVCKYIYSVPTEHEKSREWDVILISKRITRTLVKYEHKETRMTHHKDKFIQLNLSSAGVTSGLHIKCQCLI